MRLADDALTKILDKRRLCTDGYISFVPERYLSDREYDEYLAKYVKLLLSSYEVLWGLMLT
jgi:hypothetical protein